MSLISFVFGQLFWGLTVSDFSGILLVVVSTMSMGLLLSIITINVAFVSFKKGSDPDIVVYPIMSTVSDIFITVCYVLVLILYFFIGFGKLFLLMVAFAVLCTVIYILIKDHHETVFIKTIKEFLLL